MNKSERGLLEAYLRQVCFYLLQIRADLGEVKALQRGFMREEEKDMMKYIHLPDPDVVLSKETWDRILDRIGEVVKGEK